MLPSPAKGRRRGPKPSVASFVFATVVALLPLLTQGARAETELPTEVYNDQDLAGMLSIGTTTDKPNEGIEYAGLLRDMVDCSIYKLPRSLLRKMMQADIQPECSLALLRSYRAILNFEPWALRLFDASGKFPTGMFQGTHMDAGAFDQCLETVIRRENGDVVSRGQYCNLLAYSDNATALKDTIESFSSNLHPRILFYKDYFSAEDAPILRLGICFTDECSRDDLQALVNVVKPPLLRLEVSNCITAEPQPWDRAQIAIVIFFSVLLVIIFGSTCVDELLKNKPKDKKEMSILLQFVTAFSVTSNTRQLLKVADRIHDDDYHLQFLHGMRFFCCIHIVLGHYYINLSDTWSRVLNLFIASDQWPQLIATAIFNSVDTFFFLSGFFLCFTMNKQNKNGLLVFLTNVVRRLIRFLSPPVFVVMCLYLLPHFVDGPDVNAFFLKLYDDVDKHWWQFLLHIKNLYGTAAGNVRGTGLSGGALSGLDNQVNHSRGYIATPPPPPSPLVHMWYLSADFQLFLVSLLVVSIFKSRRTLAISTFVLLAGICCSFGTWVVASSHVLPFLIFPGPRLNTMTNTLEKFYLHPYYHAVCYFSGCIAFFLVEGFRQRKITKSMQIAGWCLSVSCGLASVFAKLPWYRSANPTTQEVTLIVSFFDRIFWSVFLVWITLAFSSGRGGCLSKFLSWNAFVPLSKLSFCVYLIHFPFIQLMLHASRERIFWSHFNVVTLWFATLVWSFLLAYVAYLACEAPSTTLCSLIFGKLIGRRSASKRWHPEEPAECDAKQPKTMKGAVSSCC
ncbi:nose resistant to fluoxetine protein 6-like isoform X1 [Dermacentor andersoni]|uniref:nose resistant to fluoxetine protein 6-like isoform X1 n=1 Tax=Dermacentor andersoni TaxID=34620 RepID=UPI0021554B19|nr:nose resistant to fluoxetine protein 6-like isoform X1 [Dermacentor andersoni]